MARDFVVVGGGEKIKRKEVMEMPFGDGTGPMGLGPMTGRGAGFCAGFGRPGFASSMPSYPYHYGYNNWTPMWPRRGYGFASGFGRGFGRSLGRGWRRWGPYGYYVW
jgi:hypothetical protein